jgi:hypothetical protein
MRIGRPPILPKPFVLSDSFLYSSDLTESEYTAYSSTATVAVADLRQHVSPTSTVTISNGTPALITWANHMLSNGTPITLTTTGTLPTGLSVGIVYFVRDALQGSFYLCASPNSPALSTSSAGSGVHTATATRHDVYEAAIATTTVTASITTTVLTVTVLLTGTLASGHILSGTGVTSGTYIINQLSGTAGGVGTYSVSVSQSVSSTTITGNAPVTNETFWNRYNSTNKWRMFDSSVSSQSSRANTLEVELRPTGRYNSLYLGNIVCDTVRVQVKDSTGTSYYDETYSGIALNWDVSFYSWYFDPIEYITDLYLTDLPNILTPRITITFTNTNDTVQCGACVPTMMRELGGTQYGMSVGIKDYSIKEVDSRGNSRLEERSFARTCRALVMLDNTDVDAITNILSSYRATAIIYEGSSEFSSSLIFGWFNDFNNEVQYQSKSLLSIEMESLT